jgi:hypothetical protein
VYRTRTALKNHKSLRGGGDQHINKESFLCIEGRGLPTLAGRTEGGGEWSQKKHEPLPIQST